MDHILVYKELVHTHMRAQSCLALYNFMDCSPPGFSVHGILQARILQLVAVSSCRGSSWPRDWNHVSWVSCIGKQILCHWTTCEAPDNLYIRIKIKLLKLTDLKNGGLTQIKIILPQVILPRWVIKVHAQLSMVDQDSFPFWFIHLGYCLGLSAHSDGLQALLWST